MINSKLIQEQCKNKIFTQAVDFIYSNDSNENYYSYDGLDMQNLDKILEKENFSFIDDDLHDNSTIGGLSEAESKHKYSIDSCKTKDTFTVTVNVCKDLINFKPFAPPKMNLTSFFKENWKTGLNDLKKQLNTRINKNTFLEGSKFSNRKMTYDTTSSSFIKKHHGFSN